MFGKAWRVGRIGGVPINVDSSWVWIAVLVTYSLYVRFDYSYSRVSTRAAVGFAVISAALFFGSVLLHELAHAGVARANDIQVQGVTLVIFGGFTSARSDEKGPGPAFLISAVGPATSLALGAFFWALSRILESVSAPFAGAFGYVGWVNLFMAGFNVLPGLPLDGGRMLLSAVWRLTGNQDRATRIAARTGVVVGILLIAGGALVAARGHARGDTFIGVWLAVIGWMILQGARASEKQLGLRELLSRGIVAQAMDPPPSTIPAEMSLSEALDRFLRGHEGEAFPVTEEGKVIGMVSFGSARDVGMHDPLRPVRDALIPLADVLVATTDERLDEVSDRLGPGGSALVLRDGELAGAITPGAIARWLRARPVA